MQLVELMGEAGSYCNVLPDWLQAPCDYIRPIIDITLIFPAGSCHLSNHIFVEVFNEKNTESVDAGPVQSKIFAERQWRREILIL